MERFVKGEIIVLPFPFKLEFISLIVIMVCCVTSSCTDKSLKLPELSHPVPLSIGKIWVNNPPETFILNYNVDMQIGQFTLSNALPLSLDHNSRLRFYYIEHVKIKDQKENQGYIKFDFKKNIWDYNRLIIMGDAICGKITFSLLDGCYRFNDFYVGDDKWDGYIDYESKNQRFYFTNMHIGEIDIKGYLEFEVQTGRFHFRSFSWNKNKIAGYVDSDGCFLFDYNIYSDGTLTAFEYKRFVSFVLLLFPIFVDFQYETGGVDLSSEQFNKYRHHPVVDSGCMGWTKACSDSCYRSCSKGCYSFFKKGCQLGGCKRGCNEAQCTYVGDVAKNSANNNDPNIPVLLSLMFIVVYFGIRTKVLNLSLFNLIISRILKLCKMIIKYIISVFRKLF